MKNLNLVKKKILKEKRQLSVRDSSKLLAEFFNGLMIELEEK